MQTHISFGKGGNSIELTMFPEESIFPQMPMHKKCPSCSQRVHLTSSPKRDFFCISLRYPSIYRLTYHVGQNLPLTSEQKFRFGLPGQGRPGQNGTCVLKSTGGFGQRDGSPCSLVSFLSSFHSSPPLLSPPRWCSPARHRFVDCKQ